MEQMYVELKLEQWKQTMIKYDLTPVIITNDGVEAVAKYKVFWSLTRANQLWRPLGIQFSIRGHQYMEAPEAWSVDSSSPPGTLREIFLKAHAEIGKPTQSIVMMFNNWCGNKNWGYSYKTRSTAIVSDRAGRGMVTAHELGHLFGLQHIGSWLSTNIMSLGVGRLLVRTWNKEQKRAVTEFALMHPTLPYWED